MYCWCASRNRVGKQWPRRYKIRCSSRFLQRHGSLNADSKKYFSTTSAHMLSTHTYTQICTCHFSSCLFCALVSLLYENEEKKGFHPQRPNSLAVSLAVNQTGINDVLYWPWCEGPAKHRGKERNSVQTTKTVSSRLIPQIFHAWFLRWFLSFLLLFPLKKGPCHHFP